MPEQDWHSKVVALEVHVNNHKEKLDEIKDNIEDIYNKYGDHNKELTGVLVQLRGMVSQFSEISVKIQEMEDNIDPMVNKLDGHIEDFEKFVEKSSVLAFIKDNPGLTVKILALGGLVILLIVLLSKSVPGMAVLKFVLGLVGLRT